MHILDIFNNYLSLFDTTVKVNGWITTTRSQKDITFIKLNDGTHPDGIQLILTQDLKYNQEVDKHNLSIGTSLQVEGFLVKSPAEGQLFELVVAHITILGQCDINTYPLSKSKMSLEYLRSNNLAHLRFRTSTFGSVFRIKSAINNATHQFFNLKKYFHLDPNIITVNECEGGAGVFQITEKDISIPSKLALLGKSDKYDWATDHFQKPTYLTVSSQLQLEALACALGSVYTMNKSFRSEHSTTTKHLSEFTHLEIESCFITLDELMQVGEDYIKYVGQYLLDNCIIDIENLNKFVAKGLKDRIKTITDATFKRIKYTEAIRIAQEKGKQITFGEDLSSEIENCLTEHFNSPVFITHWPIAIKSFYMKQDSDDITLCHNFDLLMPYKIGELIGGSMREDNYDKLITMMKMKGIAPESLKFYTDLRLYGSVPHGGFGLGFERLTMLFTGMENIKDTVPFPVSYHNCEY